ncbi:MAG: C13 family peptidase [Xanthobacteraceae bacterium]
MWRVLKLAARAGVWRTTPDPPFVGLPVLLAFAVMVAVVRVAMQLLAAGSWRAFDPYGLNATVAWLALELAVAALFVRPTGRATALSAMFVLSIVADLVAAGIKLGMQLLAPAATQWTPWNSAVTADVIFAIVVVWWVGGMTSVIGSLEPQLRLRLIGRAAALWVALFIVNALVPHAPVFVPPGFDARNANWWEYLYARNEEKSGGKAAVPVQLAQLEKAQPALLEAEVARLAPPQKGITGIYALGIAGWADQGVFLKELDGGLQSIASVLPIKDRTVRLINHRDTIATLPLADLQNFRAAVHAIGDVMDKTKDVLVLFMTSHGEKTGFALELPGAVGELTPQEVASTLDSEGIKNRVVIVSACYAGIFIPPLQNANTIVMTAADANNTSFGCAPERDWTYFGDAFFRQSLHPGSDFENAFDHARILIQGWELMDHDRPSNPQGQFGAALVDKLAPFFASAQTAAQ